MQISRVANANANPYNSTRKSTSTTEDQSATFTIPKKSDQFDPHNANVDDEFELIRSLMELERKGVLTAEESVALQPLPKSVDGCVTYKDGIFNNGTNIDFFKAWTNLQDSLIREGANRPGELKECRAALEGLRKIDEYNRRNGGIIA